MRPLEDFAMNCGAVAMPAFAAARREDAARPRPAEDGGRGRFLQLAAGAEVACMVQTS